MQERPPSPPNGVLFFSYDALNHFVKHGVDFVNCFRPVCRPKLFEYISDVNFHGVWSELKSIGNRLVCLSLPQDLNDVPFPWCEHSPALELITPGSEHALNIMQVLGRDENTSGQSHRYCFDANRYSGVAWKITTCTLL